MTNAEKENFAKGCLMVRRVVLWVLRIALCCEDLSCGCTNIYAKLAKLRRTGTICIFY